MGDEVSITVKFSSAEYGRFKRAIVLDPADVLRRLALKAIGESELHEFAKRQQDDLRREAARLNKELGLE